TPGGLAISGRNQPDGDHGSGLPRSAARYRSAVKRWRLVARHHHDHKTPRLGRWTTARSRLLFLEFERRQIHSMRLRVNVHGLGAEWSRHGLHNLKFAAALTGNVQ